MNSWIRVLFCVYVYVKVGFFWYIKDIGSYYKVSCCVFWNVIWSYIYYWVFDSCFNCFVVWDLWDFNFVVIRLFWIYFNNSKGGICFIECRGFVW